MTQRGNRVLEGTSELATIKKLQTK
jgi:hypothetical protein